VRLAHAKLVAGGAERAAQRDLYALGQRGEIRLTVERSENGAAHQGRAAQSGEDGSGEPLDRDTAAVDEAAIAAVDGQRRLVAELEHLGSSGSMGAAQPCVLQPASPCALDRRWLPDWLPHPLAAESSGTMPGAPTRVNHTGRSRLTRAFGVRETDLFPAAKPPSKGVARTPWECGFCAASQRPAGPVKSG